MTFSAADVHPRLFALVIGNARSGSTILGSALDAHPNMLCANETMASANLWRGADRQAIIAEIVGNSRWNYENGRPSQGYRYRIDTPEKTAEQIAVVGDKIWNPALLFLHGDNGLLPALADRMGCPLALIHCVRNPFDVIATMHARSGASLDNRMRWFFMHCEAVTAVAGRALFPTLVVRHEQFVLDPTATAAGMFRFLGQPVEESVLSNIRQRVFPSPRRSRDTVEWPRELVGEIRERSAAFDFLAGYDLDGP